MDSPEPRFRIEFRYTREDLAEGSAPLPEKMRSFYSTSRANRLIRGILFAALSAMIVFLGYVAVTREEAPESWNFDVTLPAVLLPAIYLFLVLVHQIWATWRRTRPGGRRWWRSRLSFPPESSLSPWRRRFAWAFSSPRHS